MNKKSDNLGDRMKAYEAAFKQVLPGRMPVIIRCDGKAFHTYTKSLKKSPGVAFDPNMELVMNRTAMKLCEEIQGAQMAYVQSDEISVLIHGYKTITSQGWFNNELQKIISVSAAIASSTFTSESWRIWAAPGQRPEPEHPNYPDPRSPMNFIRPAYFDSRAFVLPESEVCNYFHWRQADATRNSVQMLARALYSHKECTNKSNKQLKEMTAQKGRDWDGEPTSFKRGRCIEKYPVSYTTPPNGVVIYRWKWAVKAEIPVFTEHRDYIEKHLALEGK